MIVLSQGPFYNWNTFYYQKLKYVIIYQIFKYLLNSINVCVNYNYIFIIGVV